MNSLSDTFLWRVSSKSFLNSSFEIDPMHSLIWILFVLQIQVQVFSPFFSLLHTILVCIDLIKRLADVSLLLWGKGVLFDVAHEIYLFILCDMLSKIHVLQQRQKAFFSLFFPGLLPKKAENSMNGKFIFEFRLIGL